MWAFLSRFSCPTLALLLLAPILLGPGEAIHSELLGTKRVKGWLVSHDHKLFSEVLLHSSLEQPALTRSTCQWPHATKQQKDQILWNRPCASFKSRQATFFGCGVTAGNVCGNDTIGPLHVVSVVIHGSEQSQKIMQLQSLSTLPCTVYVKINFFSLFFFQQIFIGHDDRQLPKFSLKSITHHQRKFWVKAIMGSLNSWGYLSSVSQNMGCDIPAASWVDWSSSWSKSSRSCSLCPRTRPALPLLRAAHWSSGTRWKFCTHIHGIMKCKKKKKRTMMPDLPIMRL